MILIFMTVIKTGFDKSKSWLLWNYVVEFVQLKSHAYFIIILKVGENFVAQHCSHMYNEHV